MSQGSQPSSHADLAAKAANPTTSQAELHQLAADQPALRPLIAQNPNTYPQLLDWLGQLNDPAVDAALAQRSSAGEHQPTDDSQQTRTMPAADAEASGHTTEEFGAVQQPRHQPAPGQQAQKSDFDERIYGVPETAPADPGPSYAQAPGPDYQSPVYTYPPAAYPAAEPERAPRRRGGGCLVILLLGLLTLAALAISYLLLFGNPFSIDEQQDPPVEDQQQPAPEQGQQEGEEEPAPEDSPSPTEGDDGEQSRPAPDGALDTTAFSAPSGNIHCALSDDEVTCTIDEYFFDAPSGCDEAVTVRVGRDGTAETNCDETISSQGEELGYGETTSNEDFACVAGEAHFECWSQQTGNGFELAREYYNLNEY